jgi:hypothetical protein
MVAHLFLAHGRGQQLLALGRVVSPPVRRETYENYSANYAYMCVYFTI